MRLPEESNAAFLERAKRSAAIARALINACLQNRKVQELIREGRFTEESIRRSPIVRVEFDQAIAIGGIGETLDAAKSKFWGDGPSIMPLEAGDDFFPDRITYVYRENSLYNRRFEQRIRMKELLGKKRALVGNAKYWTKAVFLKQLAADQANAIRRCLGVEPSVFWRAAKGRVFLDLPRREIQREFNFPPQNCSGVCGEP